MVIGVAVLWLFLAGLMLLEVWPGVPSSWAGRLLFLIFAAPLYVLCEFASEWLWSTRPGRSIAEHPSRAARIAVGVALGVAAVALLAVATSYLAGGAP
jgi:hypothetical protein